MTIDSIGSLNVPGVYNDTTSSSANVNVHSDGHIRRSTSSRRYKNTITSRQHTKEHIIDLVVAYCDKCCEIIEIPPESSIEVFVMERESPCFEEQKTKDGIHIIISLQMHKALQVILRNKMLEEIKDIWSDLPITNQWDDVLDEGVTRGFSNWQMYGSQKPNYKPYKLTYYFKLAVEKDGCNITPCPISEFNVQKDFLKLSARNNKIPKFFFFF